MAAAGAVKRFVCLGDMLFHTENNLTDGQLLQVSVAVLLLLILLILPFTDVAYSFSYRGTVCCEISRLNFLALAKSPKKGITGY